MAEQCIDREVRAELFRGRRIELVIGRALLHALDGHGQALCRADVGQLTPVGRPWDVEYLPHVPRCRNCAQLGDLSVPGGTDGRASGVDIRTAHGTDEETAASDALRAILDQYDLRRWMCTDVVTVDETFRGGISHPLTIGTARLAQRPALTLTTFLHEQLHWLEGPGVDSANAEAEAQWPDPPPSSAGGAQDPTSTWLHLTVCALEYRSLSEILGPAAAKDELRQHGGYSWIYGRILDDTDWFADFLDRHGLRVPEQPPVPRRCFSGPWWESPR
jgi:hypothetical protein